MTKSIENAVKQNRMLMNMRLLIEGAIALYEDEASDLIRPVAKSGKMPEAAMAFDLVGAALYETKAQLKTLHEDFLKESNENG